MSNILCSALTIFSVLFPLFPPAYSFPRHVPPGVELLTPDKLEKPLHIFSGLIPKSLNPTRKGDKVFDIFDKKKAAQLAASGLGSFKFVQEISKPILGPKGSEICGIVRLLVNRPFGDNSTQVRATYVPPAGCNMKWRKIKLTASGKGIGFQSSRFLDVFLDGLHLLRLTTPNGINETAWVHEADVTKYGSFLTKPHRATVTLPNRIPYGPPGSYNITLALTFYSGNQPSRYADVIIPIGTNASDYASFALTNETNTFTKAIDNFPRNAYRAQLEILTIPRGADQLLAFSVPVELAKKLPFIRSAGVFREIQASVDGLLAGAVWPKTVLQPFFLLEQYWRDLVGIGVYNIPSFFLDITPFIGQLVDGKSHTIKFRIPEISAGSTWLTSAVLHIWLDNGSTQTSGMLTSRKVVENVRPRIEAVISKDGQKVDVRVTATRTTSIIGRVYTSFGNFTSFVLRQQRFVNVFRARGKTQAFSLDQDVSTYSGSILRRLGQKNKNGTFYSMEENYRYPLKLLSEGFSTINGYYSQSLNHHKSLKIGGNKRLVEHLENKQEGFGYQIPMSNNAGASMSQNYTFRSNYDGCYMRKFESGLASQIKDKGSRRC